jgi:hypothetical protein
MDGEEGERGRERESLGGFGNGKFVEKHQQTVFGWETN